MQINKYEFMVDSMTKFFNTIRISGWFHHKIDVLKDIKLHNFDILAETKEINVAHGGVLSLGVNKGFSIQILTSKNEMPDNAEIEFITKSRTSIKVLLSDLCLDRLSRYPTPHLGAKFRDLVNKNQYSVLDIGGRARSKVARKEEFDVNDYIVMDIVPGDNVVGDAHKLASFFPAEHFDAFYSVCVFEHLMMPWTVVTQINKVLKMGGIGLVFTHQTIGLHDMPWDFWRFSDTAWDALFNEKTGFKILDRAMDTESYILPFIYRPSKETAEQSAGFEGSAVLVEKIGSCQLEWNIAPSDISNTAYPEGEDGYDPQKHGNRSNFL